MFADICSAAIPESLLGKVWEVRTKLKTWMSWLLEGERGPAGDGGDTAPDKGHVKTKTVLGLPEGLSGATFHPATLSGGHREWAVHPPQGHRGHPAQGEPWGSAVPPRALA